MKKITLRLLFTLVVLAATSCQKSAERVVEKIKLEEIEKFEIIGIQRASITLRIDNGSGYKLALDRATMDVYYGNSIVANISLREPVNIPRRTTMSVYTEWQMRIADPLAFFVLASKIKKKELDRIGIGFSIEGKGGPKKVGISRTRMPLSEFLNIFGISTNQITDYLTGHTTNHLKE